ncbi:MAG: hypothetical protein KJN63_01750 [Acidimicrobiia bacterium]|nr:hypothetical protein [Acidimicrobiia bacterium]
MKLYDRPNVDEKLDRLPELPEGVEVPDDISGLRPPTTLKSTGGATRWMRWLAVILVLGAIGLAGVLVVQSYSTTEIDQARVNVTATQHLAQLADLTADPIAVDYMELYGTDNPVFVAEQMFGPNEGPGSNSLAATMPEAAEHPYADFFG